MTRLGRGLAAIIPSDVRDAGRPRARSEKERDFLRKLVGRLRPDLQQKPVLFYDQHRSHTTRESLNLAKRHFYPLENAVASSDFNCIESVWSLAKRNLAKLLQLHPEPITARNAEKLCELIEQAIGQITAAQYRGMLNSNRRSLRRYLLQQQQQ